MSNVYARVSNGVVREVIYFDPQGDFAPNLTWVQVSNSITTGANISGDTYAVQPRWSYDGMMFAPPLPPVPQPRPTGHATYVDHFVFLGQGENIWVEIGNVNIISNLNIAHFLSYSLDVYDGNLVPYSTQIHLPNGSTSGGSNYGGGSETAGNAGDAAQAALEASAAAGAGVGGIGLGLDAVAAALDAAAAAAAAAQAANPDSNTNPGASQDAANQGAGGTGGCFVAETPILMKDGNTRPISHLVPGDILQSDSGSVSVVGVNKRTINTVLVGFNNLPYFVTSNHPMLTDRGWGSFDNMLLAATEPGVYDSVLSNNGYKPLIDINEGTNLAIWKDGIINYVPIYNVKKMSKVETVYYLDVTGDNHYIANNIIVHNEDGK
jgi:hypothetical protein